MPARIDDEGGVTAWLDVVVRFLRLGFTSFGGPIAHLGYFRRELVERAAWVDDATFAEIVALCSVLPGPTSSQVGMTLGWRRAGVPGLVLAWLAFTTPSALALAAFGLALRAAGTRVAAGTPAAAPLAGALDALAGAAAAVVLIAVLQLGRTLATTRLARAIAAGAFALALGADRFAPALQWLPLVAGGVAGARFGPARALPVADLPIRVPRRVAASAGGALVVLLAALPFVGAHGYPGLFETFFRAGSLVFGGGHVVLPFLQTMIADGRVDAPTFFAGYGAAQAVPGPLFTFAAFLGAVDASVGRGALGALVAVLAIFAPSFLLLAAAIPLWGTLRTLPRAGPALAGVNAAVVGLLAAVLVDPIAISLARDPIGIGAAAGAFALLQFARLAPWAVVLACAAGGAAIGLGTHR